MMSSSLRNVLSVNVWYVFKSLLSCINQILDLCKHLIFQTFQKKKSFSLCLNCMNYIMDLINISKRKKFQSLLASHIESYPEPFKRFYFSTFPFFKSMFACIIFAKKFFCHIRISKTNRKSRKTIQTRDFVLVLCLYLILFWFFVCT